MKTCRICKAEKELLAFSKNKKSLDGLDGRCKTCSVIYVTAWKASKGIVPKSPRVRAFPTVDERKTILDKIRNVGCLDCGGKFPPCAMDFDHLPGSVKNFGIMQGYKNQKWEVVLAEIDKCEIVCANCHRVRTRDRR